MRPICRVLSDFIVSIVLAVLLLICPIWQARALAASAQAILQSTSAADPIGIVTFEDTEAGLLIQAEINNAPDGIHGFHIHEFGNCAAMGNAAGGHYNPDRTKHGLLKQAGFTDAHAGDLGNLDINNGKASYRETLPGLSLSNAKYPIAGRAVILHEKPDDFGQPTGNAGGRIACGTIALTAPDA